MGGKRNNSVQSLRKRRQSYGILILPSYSSSRYIQIRTKSMSGLTVGDKSSFRVPLLIMTCRKPKFVPPRQVLISLHSTLNSFLKHVPCRAPIPVPTQLGELRLGQRSICETILRDLRALHMSFSYFNLPEEASVQIKPTLIPVNYPIDYIGDFSVILNLHPLLHYCAKLDLLAQEIRKQRQISLGR